MNREYQIIISIFLFLIPLFMPGASSGADPAANIPDKMCLSPGRSCTESIVKEINSAKSEVRLLAYTFTSAPIAKALGEAHKRGVKVKVILGKSQRRDTSATMLVNMMVPIYVDNKHTMVGSEIMIIDRSQIITGPFGSRKASEEKNAENVLFIKSRDLAKTYLENWSLHKEHSKPYQANQTVASKGKR